ncbi:hypothetical protein B4135_3502 [Caldibacillus debilis]|uniref:Uncharacterized protein n=1 Tax=Caldibacillus debilis TaxID=301148 RepID=A0A150LDC0_9BACI|nr:hypothetical protein B4135_3502 [Caldibacillus debilis]
MFFCPFRARYAEEIPADLPCVQASMRKSADREPVANVVAASFSLIL